jgi:hypothetical protein
MKLRRRGKRNVDGETEIQVRIDGMKTKTAGLILALCFFGTASCFAATHSWAARS